MNGVAHHAQASGALSAIGVGVSFFLVTMPLYTTFAAGASISLASPLIRLVGLLVAAITGLLLWGEPRTLRYAIGMLLTCSGLYLLITR
jgi:drug/metabolite transporter (DMT)-like permease